MESNNENPKTNINSTIDAMTGLVQAVPIYHDALQPAAKQIGNSLVTVTKTVNIALAPIKVLVWGYDQIEAFITKRLSEKLCNVPEENITTPQPHIAGPVIEALRFTANDINIRELYANLLATAMDKSTILHAHPSFVEIIKNLSSEEAILLKYFSKNPRVPLIDVKSQSLMKNSFSTVIRNYSHLFKNIDFICPDLVPSYLDNLCRLGLLEIPFGTYINIPNTYDALESDFSNLKIAIDRTQDSEVKFERKIIELTSFGNQFIKYVVNDK